MEKHFSIEINKPFTALLSSLNALLQTATVTGYKIFDGENESYSIDKVVYDGTDDKIKFKVKDNKTFDAHIENNKPLLLVLNALLKTLNTLNYKVYDVENKDYFINEFVYDNKDSKLKFKLEEEN